MQRHHDQGPFDLAGHNHELTHNAVWLHFGGCSAGKVARFGNQLQQTGQISVIATKSVILILIGQLISFLRGI